jgi:hypothetical protein
MMDLLSFLATLKRPRLLIRAARYGVQEYRRDPHLTRILGTTDLPRSGSALSLLINEEMDLNDLRKKRAADYSPARHIDILIAMMGEAQMLGAATHTNSSQTVS